MACANQGRRDLLLKLPDTRRSDTAAIGRYAAI